MINHRSSSLFIKSLYQVVYQVVYQAVYQVVYQVVLSSRFIKPFYQAVLSSRFIKPFYQVVLPPAPAFCRPIMTDLDLEALFNQHTSQSINQRVTQSMSQLAVI